MKSFVARVRLSATLLPLSHPGNTQPPMQPEEKDKLGAGEAVQKKACVQGGIQRERDDRQKDSRSS